MEKLEKKLMQSVQEIRSRYEYDCMQFTIDLFDDIEDRIDSIYENEIGIDVIIGSLCYKVSIILEIINPHTTDCAAIIELNKMLEQYYEEIEKQK